MAKWNKPIFRKNQRSTQIEIMDSVNFQGREMESLLQDIEFVNRWLGGDHIAFKGIKKLIEKRKIKEITLLDVGCGDGNTLRKCSDYLRKLNISTVGIGVDFNENILEEAIRKSTSYPNLKFKQLDILTQTEALPLADIAIFSLFLHHFKDQEIIEILKNVLEKTEYGMIVNDLKRSKSAFLLFKLFSSLFLKTNTARYDGLVSIARGFQKNDLNGFSKKISNQKSSISEHWAFRFLWILKKNNIKSL